MGASEIKLPVSGEEIKGEPARKERNAPSQLKVEFSRLPVILTGVALETFEHTLWITPVAAGFKKRPLMAPSRRQEAARIETQTGLSNARSQDRHTWRN
jgi:hypothetical protein